MENRRMAGHLAAVFTIVVWGTTFISTKVLLKDFQPVEILFIRFVMGYIALWLARPGRLDRFTAAGAAGAAGAGAGFAGTGGAGGGDSAAKRELIFCLAGLCGVCLYYLLENIALTYTLASNVGVIISAAPSFAAILTHLFAREKERMGVNFFVGFVVAMAGICLISFNGSAMELNPTGDLLALLAAFVWACYSILTRKIGEYGYNTIRSTRRIFGYGILFMIPALFIFGFEFGPWRFAEPVYLLNLIYLGLGASATCFVTWNFAVRALGAVKTSVYIYLVPVITVVTSVLVLGEVITAMSGLGTVLTLAGLALSELRIGKREKK